MKKIYIVPLMLMLLMSCASVKENEGTVFYPMPPQTPRLQFLTSISAEEDIGKEKNEFMEFLLGQPQSMRQIARPHAIGSSEGKIYVSDRTFKKVLVLDLEKKEFEYIKDEKSSALMEPGGIWITDNDYKYIADFGRKQVLAFDNANEFIKAYGSEGQFAKPLDVAVFGNRLYVCDFEKHEITVVDMESGETVNVIGGIGNEEGKLYKPTHITVDEAGNLYVNDSFNFRIQKYDPDGNYLKHFGYQGDTIGGFARPKGIAVDNKGLLYAVDTAFENVQIFDEESTLLLLFFGGYGPKKGSMYLPNAVHVDYKNIKHFQKYVDNDFKILYLVYVGNMLGDKKINVYGFGEWIGEPLPGIEKQKIKFE